MDAWLTLLRRALAIMDSAFPGTIPDDWTLGGGTVLFRRYSLRRTFAQCEAAIRAFAATVAPP